MNQFKRLIKSTFILGILVLFAACSSSDPTKVAADFSAEGIKGKIEGEIVVIDLSDLGNCATTIENMTIAAETFGASVSPDPRVARDYTNPVEFTITASDGTKLVVKVKVKGAECISKPVVTNTPLVLGSLTCTPVNAFPFNLAVPVVSMNCEITANDPDGISIFEFTLAGSVPYPDSIQNQTNEAPRFTVELTCSNNFYEDPTLTFKVKGKKSDGSAEDEQTASLVVSYKELCSHQGG